MNIFKRSKVVPVLSVYTLIVFKFFRDLWMKKVKSKLLPSKKLPYLLILKIILVQETVCDPEKPGPAITVYVHWRKSTNSREAKIETTNDREGKLGQKF